MKLTAILILFSMTLFGQEMPQLAGHCFPVTTNSGNNGAISLTCNGGVTPYSFKWSNGATSQDVTGLTAGEYTVTMTDAAQHHAFGFGLVLSQPNRSSGMYVDKNANLYDFTTEKLPTTVKAGTLIPVPVEYLGLCKTLLKGQTSGKIDRRFNNGLTRWFKTL